MVKEDELNNVDNEFTCILLDIKKRIPELPDFWWLLELHARHLICQYWHMVISFHWNNIKDDGSLESIKKCIPRDCGVFQVDPKRPIIYQLI
eukprot:2189245-Ditylum_brightwellii.AAC.1